MSLVDFYASLSAYLADKMSNPERSSRPAAASQRGLTSDKNLFVPDELFPLIPLILLVVGIIVTEAASRQIAAQESSPARSPSEEKQSIDKPLFDLKIPVTVEKLDLIEFPLIPSIEERIEDEVVHSGQWKKLLDKAGLSKSEQQQLSEVGQDELVGVVMDDATGKPIAGALIDAWHWTPGNQTKTDEKGMFRLKDLETRQKIEVMVSKDGYGSRVFAQRPAGAKDWVILLSNRTFFEGTITDLNGKPVAEATIRAKFGPVQADGVMIGEIHSETRSRADGTYRLHVSSNEYDIQVSAPGKGVFRQSRLKIWHHMERPLPIKLEKGVGLEARVIDSLTKMPVEGFVLYQWQPPHLLARSDKHGRIILEDLIPGPVEFQCGGGKKIIHGESEYFEHGPYGRWWSPDAIKEWERLDLHDDGGDWQRNFDGLSFNLKTDMSPVTIVVEQGVTVSGRVTDPAGQSVAGATVAPAKTGSGNSLTGDTRYSVSTDKDGSYKVVLPASNLAQYNLVVHDGKYEEWRKWANGVSKKIQTRPGEIVANFDLQLTLPAIVKGVVTMNGKPAADREVRTHDFNKMENRYYDPMVRTKADGTFELQFVRPGKHYLQVSPFWMDAQQARGGTIVIEVEAGDVLDEVELEVPQ